MKKTLKRQGKEIGKDYQVSIIHSKSHAGYYPGSTMMAIKLIFDPETGKVFGGQIVGHSGVDKRIDVLATAIRYGGTVEDLMDLELAYAPPYSSAKDPINMAAFAAENIMLDKVGVAQYYEAFNLDLEKTTLIDVRDLEENERGAVPGAILIPVNELRDRLGEIDKNKNIIVYCAIGLRGYIAARILKENGFDKVKNLSGGYTTYAAVYEGSKNSSDLNCVNCQGIPYEEEFSESGEPIHTK